MGALAAAMTPPGTLSVPDAAAMQRRALEAVYREQHAFVWRSLARLGVGDSALPDASHDVFMVVARRLPEFEGRASIKTWLFAICLRVARASRRNYARERKQRARYEAAQPTLPEQPHARADAARTLRDMLQHLDEDKRAVFIMAELEEMTAPEIAAVLSVKTATVYSRLRLARAELERVVKREAVRARREAR
ncbi:MAG: sigma-70 family RNA polymerase sigma factor [Myxococcota bacterium]